MHYDRLITTGDVGGPRSSIVENGGSCVVDGCTEIAVAAGKCNMHYKRIRRTGEDGGAQRFRARVGSGFDRKGYRVLYVSGRQQKEHRLIMEKVLGRSLRKGENVHHVDGNRANNDPKNLELWIVTQPTGQRATDKVKAAISLLRKYPELVSGEGYRMIALESQESTDLLRDANFQCFGVEALTMLQGV